MMGTLLLLSAMLSLCLRVYDTTSARIVYIEHTTLRTFLSGPIKTIPCFKLAHLFVELFIAVFVPAA